MTLHLTPESGVPIQSRAPRIDLKERAAACARTVDLLSEHGLKVAKTREDDELAAQLSVAYAENPEHASKVVTPKRVATMTPAAILETDKILKEFGRHVVESAVTVRNLVTNKLILETENPDPRVRIKALELLGKLSDVGLFTEKSEVTITHQTTDDLKAKLRQKLQKLTQADQSQDDIEDAIIIDGEAIDVDAELGYDDD